MNDPNAGIRVDRSQATTGGQPPPRRLAVMVTADIVEPLAEDRLALVSLDRRRRVFEGKTAAEVADAVRDHVYKRLLGPVVIESATPPESKSRFSVDNYTFSDGGRSVHFTPSPSASFPAAPPAPPNITVSDDGKSATVWPASPVSFPSRADDFDDAGFDDGIACGGKVLPPIPLAAELDRPQDIGPSALAAAIEEAGRVAAGWMPVDKQLDQLKADVQEHRRKAELDRMVNAEPVEEAKRAIFQALAMPKVPASQLKDGFLAKDLPTAIEAARGKISERMFRDMYLQAFPAAAIKEIRIEGHPPALMARRDDLERVGVKSQLLDNAWHGRPFVRLWPPAGGRIELQGDRGAYVFFDAAGHRVAVVCSGHDGNVFVGIVGMDDAAAFVAVGLRERVTELGDGVKRQIAVDCGREPTDRYSMSVVSTPCAIEHLDCSPGVPGPRGDERRVKVAITHLPEVLLAKLDDLNALGIDSDVYHLVGAVTLTLPPGWTQAGGEGTTFTLSDGEGRERVFIRVGVADMDDHVSIYDPDAPLL